MLSRIEGTKKQSKDPCSVLGYWGDLCTGPFSVWGIGGKYFYNKTFFKIHFF
jgi:hypothetical protein